jgi:hypothetical protein
MFFYLLAVVVEEVNRVDHSLWSGLHARRAEGNIL